LDHEADTGDEQHVLGDLEAASDYERGLARLDENGKAIVRKAERVGGRFSEGARLALTRPCILN